jgi:hypothetical protein
LTPIFIITFSRITRDFFMLTKQGFDLKNSYSTFKANPFVKGISKADVAGVGPVSLGLEALNVASGNSSVGGAVAGSAGGALGYTLGSRAMAPVAGKLTQALTPLVSKAPKAGMWKFLSKMPGWAGTVGKVGAGLTVAGMLGGKAREIGDTHAPVWKRQQKANVQLNPYQAQMLQQARLAGRAGMQQINNMGATG